MAEMQIEDWPIERLIPYARNPRKNDEAVTRVASAIQEFGFRVPIVAKSDGSLVDGHLRLKAAQKLGMTEVPVVLADDLTETQIKAFRISVNRMAELAEWDQELLALELEDLRLDGFDLDLVGFDAAELEAMLTTTEELETMPALPDGDREPFQQMTFTLHDEQAEQVKAAMDAAKALGPFIDSPNENSNGNALARICETYLSHA
jgi:ParB-like chromosome segregation protein Spo0J